MLENGKRFPLIIIIGILLFSQGCGVLFLPEEEDKEYQIQKSQYEPYRLQNTIEGYREFIARFPKNLFVKNAQEQIENLEFAPYEETNSIEGYIEFRIKYPANRNIARTAIKIEQIEIKRYETIDTIEGYREFISKYPASAFAMLAKERLQELEFRELDKMLVNKYGFDLLLYRLKLRRLKKELDPDESSGGDFTCFASFATHEGKRYFHTSLIYPSEFCPSDTDSRFLSERVFDPLLSQVLIYLGKRFKNTAEIDGFSFDISSSPNLFYQERKVLGEYYFPREPVDLFAADKLDKKELLARSVIVCPEKPVQDAKETAVPAKKPDVTSSLEMDGPGIMTMVSERDQGRDSIISGSWEMVQGSGRKEAMQWIEKRKNLRGENGIIDKRAIRYLDPPDQDGKVILIWNYKDQEKVFWYSVEPGNIREVSDIEDYRPAAERDFPLTDYGEIDPGEGRHELLRNEDYEGKECAVVESTPLRQEIPYGKRISWIDRHRCLPLKVVYYDKGGFLWKSLNILWQKRFGYWFWKKATMENVQTGNRTLITTRDVRVNVGLDDQEFTKEGLVHKVMDSKERNEVPDMGKE